ncbi:MAG: M36 family metallopeptidase, partial [Myxococcales bacterium]|nr:M36 family metallopeptidase [Myxococcales bacterium]
MARPPMLRVVSVDDNGAPAFVRALSTPPQAGVVDDPAAAAWAHLRSMVKTYGWSASVIGETELLAVHDLPRVGFVARFGRRVDGVAVLPGQLKILMRRDGALVAAGGNLGPVVAPGKAHFSLNGVEALAEAISKESGVAVSPANLMSLGEQGDFQRFQLQGGLPLHIPEAARVKPVWFATEGRLAPAFFTEFYVSSPTQVESYAVRIIVDADTGATLDRRSLTQFEAFNYRVWADGDGRPLDGPITDLTPHPTGLPDGSLPTLVPSGLVLMEGFNVNPDGEADPWLAASASQTLGNNVDAYADHAAPDGYSNGDTRATTNGARTFDWTMDFNAAPESNEASIKASVTQLFYNVNWLHDDWYFSGFDEAAGNAQASNFERGGLGGDVLRAEAQDNVFGGSRNNANMSTPSDGLSPRMQMYSWTGATTRSLVVSSAPAPLSTNTASFGPTSFNLSAQVVEGLDGVGTAQDGCEPLVNNVAGALVVISRGACAFVQKATNVQAAGGIGMILANNAAGAAPPGLGGTSTTITIGVLSITLEDGNALRTAIQAGQVTGTMSRTTAPDRDGSLDNLVVAHEWGHYLHRRLVAPCSNQQCRALSEGLADYVALHMMYTEGAALDGAYSKGIYANHDDEHAGFFGTRRVTYSTDRALNDHRLGYIQDDQPIPDGDYPFRPNG